MEEKTDSQWEPYSCCPKLTTKPNFVHSKLGAPIEVYEWLDLSGSISRYTCRYKTTTGKKVLPWTYGRLNGKEGWFCKAGAVPRSLYNQHLLSQIPDAIVLIVEGEKTANSARRIFPNVIPMTSGGSTSVSIADWSVLENRKCVIWRDNDMPGVKWEKAVAKKLAATNAASIKKVVTPSGFPDKWDLADEPPFMWDNKKLSSLIENAEDVTTSKEVKTNNKDQTQILIIELKSNSEVFYDQYQDPYIRFLKGQNQSLCLPLNSPRCKQIIKRTSFKLFGKGINKEQIEHIIDFFAYEASIACKKANLEVRTNNHGKDFFYDLGYAAAVITRNGWRVEESFPPLFRRYQSVFKDQVQLSKPKEIDDIFSLINITSANERLLFKCWLISCFIPDIAHPLLAIYGEKGSAKSTLMRIITSIIDPCTTSEVQIGKIDDLIQAAHHRLVLPLDNLRIITASTSDLLCKFVTGSGSIKRKLFTDDDDIARYLRRIVVLNGINLPVTWPDLLDRAIVIELERIPAEKRSTDKEISEKFEAMLPGILPRIFDVIVLAKQYFDDEKTRKGHLPRMADFAVWGRAIAKALGFEFSDFDKAYNENIDQLNKEALDGSPLASVIVHYLKSNSQLKGPPTTIRKILSKDELWIAAGFDPRDAPRNVIAFGRKLNEIKPNLEALGYMVRRSKSGERCIEICQVAKTLEPRLKSKTPSNDLDQLGDTLAQDIGAPNDPFAESLDALASLDSSNLSQSECL